MKFGFSAILLVYITTLVDLNANEPDNQVQPQGACFDASIAQKQLSKNQICCHTVYMSKKKINHKSLINKLLNNFLKI
jgi:hypothetical protein